METKLKHLQVMKSNCHSLAHFMLSANPVPLAQVYVYATGNAWSGLEELQGAWRHPWGDQLLGGDGKPP